ncbi:MAG: hypothetical protein U1E10_04840 [Bdellovibrionales bacterium]|nr:hypothetical protein [Bdellovibrionales bacterium]
MIHKVLFQFFAAASIFCAVPSAIASGIMTLKGKLKSYNESTLTLETAVNLYVVNKSGLSQEVLTMLKTKRTGQELVLTVSTEALANVEAKTK